MAFRFRCPACGDLMSAAETMAGMRITCPACGTGLEVPAVHAAATPAKSAARRAAGVAEAGQAPAVVEAGPVVDDVADEAPIGRRKKIPQDDMDMTPMVDVTFLLLIFFMITASYALQKSLPVPTPKPAEATAAPKTLADFENDPQWVVVRIDASGAYHVITSDFDKEFPSKHELLVQLRRARTEGRTRMLIVAHGDSRHEHVVAAVDAGSAVAMEEVKQITVEEDS